MNNLEDKSSTSLSNLIATTMAKMVITRTELRVSTLMKEKMTLMTKMKRTMMMMKKKRCLTPKMLSLMILLMSRAYLLEKNCLLVLSLKTKYKLRNKSWRLQHSWKRTKSKETQTQETTLQLGQLQVKAPIERVLLAGIWMAVLQLGLLLL